MSTYLLIDIGAGTMDILYWDDVSDLHYKAVVRSPVPYLADKIACTPGDILITGTEMGGGVVTQVLKERAREHRVVISAEASATLHHDRDKVVSWGIEIISRHEVQERMADNRFSHFNLADIDGARLETIVKGMGVPYAFDVVGICAQDHGVPPRGVSHLDFRHRMFTETLNTDPHAHTLLYSGEAVPPSMNRLKSIVRSSEVLPAKEVFIMDSGMAAIQGASLDGLARGRECVAVLDVATSHTLGATLIHGEIAGFFEYHTSDITGGKIDRLIIDLADGKLNHRQILDEGGHGAYLRKAVGFRNVERIIATGPKRRLLADSGLPIKEGAPMGDNMMTGTLGLLAAIRIRKQQKPFPVV
ncbi:MAG: pyruvate formate-lyase activating enzyme [Deltaproteobacteria bacterium]|nr:pyruvate formate-lyase activating enzyme [Deltaproteobacteria bacterium]